MGVACGPGYPLQVLALPDNKSGARFGLYASIPNAATAQLANYGLVSLFFSGNGAFHNLHHGTPGAS